MGIQNLGFLVFVVVSVTLSFIIGLWLYFDHCEKDRFEKRRLWGIFHCIKCGRIYTYKDKQAHVPCPDCSFKNNNLKY